MPTQLALFDLDFSKQQKEDAVVAHFNDGRKKTPAENQRIRELHRFFEERKANRPWDMHAEYDLLGLEHGATKRDIKNAYRRKARKLHPDAGGSDAAFKQLHDAYRRLLAATKE